MTIGIVLRAFLALGVIVSAGIEGAHAETLRIATWNVSNYSGGRVAEFQTSIYGTYQERSLAPDVLVVQEMLTASGTASFLSILNTAPGSPGDWAAAPFDDGPDTDNALFFRTSRVAMATELSPTGMTVVAVGGPSPNHPRNVNRYDLRLPNEVADLTRIAIYSSHMKAGTGSSDKNRRLLEAQRIRDDAEQLPTGWQFILGGDFNIQSSSQSAYVELTGSQAENAGRFFDPINRPGSWNNNSIYRTIHTQDPAGAGGMDDRHDQLLVSAGLIDVLGPDYTGNAAVPYSLVTWDDPNHSYRCWGNDGTSYNVSLTISGNTMVGETIAQALVTTAQGGGHLPVYMDLRVAPCLFDVECDGDLDLMDAAAFADCSAGPGIPVTGGGSWQAGQCLDAFDANADNDIDLADFAAFQRAFGE